MHGTSGELKDRVLALSKPERMALLSEIWASLHAEPAPELGEAEVQLLQARLAEHRASPHDTIPADVAHRSLRQRE